MGITITSYSVLSTDCPWKLGSSAGSAGTPSVLSPFNTGNTDGSAAGGGSAGQNSAYKYGQQHTHVGETTPTPITVVAGQVVILKYISGTVWTNGAGAGNVGPAGQTSTPFPTLAAGGLDGNGYNLPSDVIPGKVGFNGNGTVNTSGTAVTWVSGTLFDPKMIGGRIWIGTSVFTVANVTSTTTLTLTATAGTLTGAAFFFYSCLAPSGSLVGAFTDSSDNIVTGGTWDWVGWGGTSTANSEIALVVPAGATRLWMGVNDTILFDNVGNGSTGSWVMSVVQMESDFFGSGNGYAGDEGYPVQYPASPYSPSNVRDYTSFNGGHNIKQTVFLAPYCGWQILTPGGKLISPFFGQRFPRGAQNWGGAPAGAGGQQFPY